MSLVLCEFVVSMNVVFKKFISWPIGAEMNVVMEDFKQFCGLPIIYEAIDHTHILILNLSPFTLNIYFYHKMKGYSIVAQVVNYKKGFFDVFVGLLRNVNDFKILHYFSLCKHVQFKRLFDVSKRVNGI
jgi:hypothetical protein